jgi:hypothetical protein
MKYKLRFLILCVVLVGVTFPASSLLYGQTVTPATASYSFGSINVCPSGKATPAPCSATHTVSFSVAAGTTIGGIDIVLGGAPGLDFKAKADDTSTILCTARPYTEAATCTVDVTFTPLSPGARNGAVELLGGNGALLATTYVAGIGVGPQIAFSPPTRVFHSLVGGDNFSPQLVAMDGSGNLFLAVYDYVVGGGEAVQELTAASSYNGGRTLTTLVSNVIAMAVDGAGNLFLVDQRPGEANEEVRELFANETYTATRILIRDIDFNGMAIDGGGNLFFTSIANGVQEYLAASGYTTVKALGSGFSQAKGLAVDGSGNIFVGARESNSIMEIVAAGGYTIVKTLTNNGGSPAAVDAAGDIFFIGVYQNEQIFLGEVVAAGGYTTVDKLYSFAPTHVDSTGSPLAIMAQNIGSTALTASGLAFTDSDDFIHAAGSTTPPDCTASFSLAPGAECNLSIDFTPASAGMLSGSLVLTDNAGNATAATQSIALSGNGITAGGPVIHVSATALSYGSVAYPGTATKSLTITNTGGGRLIINPSANGPSYKITGNTCTGGITTGSCVLQVEFDPVSVGPHPVSLTLATNGPTNPIIPLTGTATGIFAIGPDEISITSIDFGTIYFPSQFNSAAISVDDVGVPGPITVQASIDGPDYKVTENDCLSPGIMPASVSCAIYIEFSPVSRGGHWEHLTLIPSVGSPSTIELTGIAGGTVP